jgi:hypothetical protein
MELEGRYIIMLIDFLTRGDCDRTLGIQRRRFDQTDEPQV